MKRTIALISSAAILLTGCSTAPSESEVLESVIEQAEEELNKINISEQNPSETIQQESNDVTDLPEQEEFEKITLVNQEGLYIALNGYSEAGEYGPELSLYIENYTDMTLSIRTTDFSVNDFSFYQYYADSVPGGKTSNSKLSIYNDNLSENNIDKVEHIEFKFEVANVTNPEDGTLLFTTDVISIDI